MADKKRIALFTRYLTMGGIQKVMVRLANGFAQRGHPVDLVLAKGAGAVAQEVSSSVQIVNLESNRVWTALPGLMRYLRDASPSVLVSGEVPSNIVAMWARALSGSDTKFIVTVHQNTSVHAQTAEMWYRRLIPPMIRLFYPAAHRIATVSEGIKEDLSDMAPHLESKMRVAYNPVVDEYIFDKAKEPVAHPWLNQRDEPVVLGVGRLTHQKNFDLLLRAFAKVRADRDARLIILGDGNQRENLERCIKDLGIEDRVDLHGFVSNPYAYMEKASLFVLSSVFEGLPTVLIEALACGCPVVSTDCPNGPPEILEDGKWGTLVPMNDEDALARAMLESLSRSHDPDRLRQRARHFSVKNSIDRYLELFTLDGS